MREHEVPTHVQAEDRVLLGFTFPQIVAVVAVCAIAYGAYRYAPVGPSEARMALAVLFGLVGIAMVVGKIGVSAAAPGGRRPAQVPAGSPALRRIGFPAGSRRAARPAAAGEDRPRPPTPDGQEDQARVPQPAEQEAQPAQGPPRRADALPSPRMVRQAPPQGGPQTTRPADRDAGKPPQSPEGVARGRDSPPCRGGHHRPPGRPGRRPRALAGRDRLRDHRAGGGTADIRRGAHRLRRPRRRDPEGGDGAGNPRPRLRGKRGPLPPVLGLGDPDRRGEDRLLPPPQRSRPPPSPSPGRTRWGRPGRSRSSTTGYRTRSPRWRERSAT